MDEKIIVEEEAVQPQPVKKDWLMRVTLMQFIVSAVLLGVVVLLVKVGGDDEFKTRINEILSYTLSREEINETFLRIKEFVATPTGGWVTMQPEHSSDPETTTAAVTTKAVALSQLGTGGNDLPESEVNENATFSPYILTVLPCVPADGEISSGFGWRDNPITGEHSFHSGIDIAAKENSCVRAAFFGTVLRTGNSEISGNFIIMSHSNGLETRYYHCNDILVQKGAVIRGGETIAKVGSTGRSTGPHLHFEMRLNGVRLNPEYIL